ncbi:hypothetical protein FACS1894125_5960 [Actinomycetota bacterium]|nr:hypothetical protein FACS1894125_5960 [Actinomycetota bacterium]
MGLATKAQDDKRSVRDVDPRVKHTASLDDNGGVYDEGKDGGDKVDDKKKKGKEPQYLKNSLGFLTYNYRVYYLNIKEKLLYGLIAFVVGGFVGYIFYGGQFRDPITKLPTEMTTITDGLFITVVGIVAICIFLPMRRKQILAKNKKDIRGGFRSLLDSLVGSISSGLNSVQAFETAIGDLTQQFGKDSRIVEEVNVIVQGFNNGKNVETMLVDFADRSEDDDIRSFADTFKIANSKGGSLGDSIKSAQVIINEKVEIEGEIDSAITEANNESYIMIILPIIMIIMIKLGNPQMADGYASMSGVIAVSVSIVMFIVAFFMAQRITRIKV